MEMTFITREGVAIADTLIYADIWNLITKCGFTALWGLTWSGSMHQEDCIRTCHHKEEFVPACKNQFILFIFEIQLTLVSYDCPHPFLTMLMQKLYD